MNSEKNCDNSGSICKYSTIPFKCVNELTAEKVTAETSEEKTCLARQVVGNQQLIPPSSQKSAELKKQDIFDSPQLDNLSFFKKSAAKIILFLILFLQITSDCWLPALLGATEIKVSMLVAVKNLAISCIVYAFVYGLINLFKPLFSKIILCIAILLSSLLMAVVIGCVATGNIYGPGIWYTMYESSCNFDDFASFVKSPSSLYAFISLLFLIVISITECVFICKFFKPFSKKEKKYFLTISTAFLLLLIFRNTVVRYSPGYIVDNLAYYKVIKAFIYWKNYWIEFENVMRNPHLPSNIRNNNKCDVIVFVVGESSTRNRYSLYGYKRQTNPELEKIQNQLIIFTDVISADCKTSFSWAYCFTRKTIKEPFNIQCSLMQILAQAGFSNILYTNQIWHDLHSSYIRRLFYSEDELIDLSKKMRLDDVLVEAVKNIPKQGASMALFLQLKGNHINYKDTYSDKFAVFSGVKDEYTQQLSSKWQDVYNHYDNSICHTDRIIYDIIKVFQSDKRRCAVIYFSDHGESVPTKSGMNFRDPSKKETYEIPFFIYFNPSYVKSNSSLVNRVAKNKHISLQGDRFFEGFLTIAGVDFYEFNKDNDFTSPNFKEEPRYINEGKVIYYEK